MNFNETVHDEVDLDIATPQSSTKERNFLLEAIQEMIKSGELPATIEEVEELTKKKKKTCQACGKKEVFAKRVGKSNNFVCEPCELDFNKGIFDFDEKGEKVITSKESRKSTIEEIDLSISSQPTTTQNSQIFEEVLGTPTSNYSSQTFSPILTPNPERILFQSEKKKVETPKTRSIRKKSVEISPPIQTPKRLKSIEISEEKESKKRTREKKTKEIPIEEKKKELPRKEEKKKETKKSTDVVEIKLKQEVKKENPMCDFCQRPKKLSELSKRVSPIYIKNICIDCNNNFINLPTPSYHHITTYDIEDEYLQKRIRMPNNRNENVQFGVTKDGKFLMFCYGKIVMLYKMEEKDVNPVGHRLYKNLKEMIPFNNHFLIYSNEGYALINNEDITTLRTFKNLSISHLSMVRKRPIYKKSPKMISEDLIEKIKNSIKKPFQFKGKRSPLYKGDACE